MPKRDIFVVGGSAGSSAPLKQLLSGLPEGFPGAVFISTHIPSTRQSLLPEMLSAAAALPVREAQDGEPIEPGRVYVAASDRHLLLIDSRVRYGFGPRENMSRPAIDPMFRSAALAYGPRAVGVILSGMLSDGASGLFAIKQAGGTAVVQDPLDARYGEMPCAALQAAQVDYVAPGVDLAGVLLEIVGLDAGAPAPPPDSLAFEVDVAAGRNSSPGELKRFADPTTLTCPECGGVRSQVSGQKPLRFRCQIGHAYSGEDLTAESDKIDEAIRVALRVMEERAELVRRIATEARGSGRTAVAELYEQRTAEYDRYATTLRDAAITPLRTLRTNREARDESR